MSQSHGQKVTKDPRSKIPIHEGVGVVTSDSLAAESLQGSGHFGEGNPKAAASAQPSGGSTAANTDTSGARKLDPAVDAEARDAASNWSEQSQLSAGSGLGLGKEHGVGPTYNKVGGATGYGTSTQPPSSNVEEVQGGYAGAADRVLEKSGAYHKMPGKNVHEDPSLTGKSEFGPIGTKKDPARVAEREQAKKSQVAAGVELKGVQQQDGSEFSVLSEEAA
ncbi:hypothetical protein E8E12_009221 [Didymella heteroderae]|uniref:Uncharacterized protein n=1 Tax=Didymella heteroderae TaxID=1769908 RepID=A0A9P4X0G9_9PLEO|nr:hypothetical protein E8E12_009221 [Didymella heteroderae]